MDFVISDTGVLSAYHGSEERVVLPQEVKYLDRDCEFAHPDKVKTVALPKSFLGHANMTEANAPYSERTQWSFELDAKGQVKDVLIEAEAADDVLLNDKVHTYLGHLNLPKLESIEVDEDNPVYTSVNGVLFTKCKRHLVFIPENYQQHVLIEPSFESRIFQYVDKRILRDRPEYVQMPVFFEVKGESFKFSQLNGLSDSTPYFFVFYGLDVKRIEDFPEYPGDVELTAPALVLPKLELFENIEYIESELTLGYCYEPDLFNQELALFCQERLYNDEQQIYFLATDKHYDKAAKFLDSLWASQKPLQVDLTEREMLIFKLQQSVLHGSVADVQSILNDNASMSVTDPDDQPYLDQDRAIQVLGLALRYGGMDKVKLLLDSPVYADEIKTLLEQEYDSDDQKRDIFIWLTGAPGVTTTVCTPVFASNSKGEARGLMPLAVEQRIELFKLLQERGLINDECTKLYSAMYFYALLHGEDDFAQMLKGFDVSIKRFATDVENAKYTTFESYILDFIEPQPENFVNVLKAAEDEKYKISIEHASLYKVREASGEHFVDILSHFVVSSKLATELITWAIERDNLQDLSDYIKAGFIKTAKTLDKFIAISEKEQMAELTKYLLECKDTLFAKPKAKSK